MQELRYGDEVLKEGEHFKIIKDRFQNEHYVAIVSHPIWLNNQVTGRVQMMAVRKETERSDVERLSRFRSVRDKATGLLFGINPHIDTFTGQIEFASIPMGPMIDLDLADKNQREQWACLSRSQTVENSPNQIGRPVYKVYDIERKAAIKLETRKERKRAVSLFDALDAIQRRDVAIALGINPDAYSSTALEMELAEFVENPTSNNYKKFLDVWEAPNKDVIITFKRAVKTGIITYTPTETRNGNAVSQRGFYYNQIHLGNNEENAIVFLSNTENSALCGSINAMSVEREKSISVGGNKVINTQKTEAKTPPVNGPSQSYLDKVAYENQIAEMKREIAELQKERNFKREANIGEKVEKPKEENPKKEEPKDELEFWRGEGKKFGVRGVHNMTDIEAIKRKIDERKLLANA